jgi:hypothetical protein
MAAAQSSTVSADSGRSKPHLFSSYSVCVVAGDRESLPLHELHVGKTSAGEPSAATRPLDMTISLSAPTHSDMWWVINITVMPFSRHRLVTVLITSARPWGSSMAVGSSRAMTRAPWR